MRLYCEQSFDCAEKLLPPFLRYGASSFILLRDVAVWKLIITMPENLPRLAVGGIPHVISAAKLINFSRKHAFFGRNIDFFVENVCNIRK
jgi:hypothetical protein